MYIHRGSHGDSQSEKVIVRFFARASLDYVIMLVIKTNYEGDFRRFSVNPSEIDFLSLIELLNNSYNNQLNIPLSHSISYLNTVSNCVEIRSHEDFKFSIIQFENFRTDTNPIFRINIEKRKSFDVNNKSIQIKEEVPNLISNSNNNSILGIL
jgi:hypothetical protein